MRVNYFIVLLSGLLLVSCANTKVTESWLAQEHTSVYRHLMIIGVSDSQQTRQIFENYFVAELRKENITATPSYTLINSKQKMNRETVVNSIQGTDIDAVLITYLVSSETEVKHHDSPLSRTYSGDADTNKVSATLISTRGRTSDTEIIILKNDFYDARTKSLVWSAQTRTVAPESIDEVVINVTALLIEQLIDDDLLK